ncbi:putative DNA glycosylase At3g47830 [Andrographis paniculata]|uniref:putative DNA glycosylase At3g47830 n=1 Tax=Andrographis paniculata TaxID=175694 RepID=UPI0021E6EC09|nr:putative DNA glycosylase At3g47830 [Andrographis paniculata]
MERIRKRKHSSVKPPKSTTIAAVGPPFLDYLRPTAEECLSVRDDLLSHHGFPQEFLKYRNRRMRAKPYQNTQQLPEEDGEEIETVLDGLVRTVLSQNTTELNSERAFASLKKAFPTWENVLAADSKCIEDVIRCGGLAPTKSSCIKNLLSWLLEKKGKLCMEYLRELSIEEVKAELSLLKGIGPKTVACVLLFNLQLDDFPVDTHVFQIAKTIGWVPPIADIKKTYVHLNHRIPADLKFDLNCLLYAHGKVCRRCAYRKVDRKSKEETDGNGSCPLLAYSGCSTVT